MAENRQKKCVLTEKLLKQSTPILAFPDYSLPLHSDASGPAIAGVLLQQKPNQLLKPLAFCSRKLNPTEQRYSKTEREMKALTYSLQQFKHVVHTPLEFD